MKSQILFTILIAQVLVISACKKSDYLDAKPDQALIIPESVEELQSLMDNLNVINGTG